MYDLPYFRENDADVIMQFVRDHPFAVLAGCSPEGMPVLTQVPVFIDEREGKLFLSGHIMRNTDHHKAFVANPNVLAVFTGPHCYVSATLYDNPNQASTWNYMSVHARGHIRFGDFDELVSILRRLTLHYENNNARSSTVFDNLPADYRERLMKAIVAFEVEITSLENVFKLSQNRDEKSYDNISSHLKGQGGDAAEIGRLMEERKSKVFGS